MTWTPGPWEFVQEERAQWVQPENHDWIAEIHEVANPETTIASGKLMARAPEMAALLQRLVRELPGDPLVEEAAILLFELEKEAVVYETLQRAIMTAEAAAVAKARAEADDE